MCHLYIYIQVCKVHNRLYTYNVHVYMCIGQVSSLVLSLTEKCRLFFCRINPTHALTLIARHGRFTFYYSINIYNILITTLIILMHKCTHTHTYVHAASVQTILCVLDYERKLSDSLSTMCCFAQQWEECGMLCA